MRLMLVAVSVLAAAPAYAGVALPGLDANALPPSCRWTADVPANAPLRTQFAAVVSAANCNAMVQLRTADRDPSEAGAHKLADALAPSFALLDNVIRNGDTEAVIAAEYAKGDLLSGMRVFLVSSVPRVGSMRGADLATYMANISRANRLTRQYGDSAAMAFAEVRRLATNPDGRALVRRDPVIAYMVRDARIGAAAISQR